MGEELTERKISIFREAFEAFDKDRDGYLTIKEISAIVKEIGQPPTEGEIKDMINEVDVDGNGTVEFIEFITLMARKMRDADTLKEDLKEIFDAFDMDKSGAIEHDELKKVMRSIGENVSDEDIADMIKEADEDGNDAINFEEFYKKVTNFK